MYSFVGHRGWVWEGDMPPPAEGGNFGNFTFTTVSFSPLAHASRVITVNTEKVVKSAWTTTKYFPPSTFIDFTMEY